MSTDRQLAYGVRESIHAMTGYSPPSKRERRQVFLSSMIGLTVAWALGFGAYLLFFKLVLRA